MKKYLMLFCCVLGFSAQTQSATLKFDENKTCTRFKCGSATMAWEDNMKCAVLPKKHPNCLKAMLAATKNSKKGKFNDGFEKFRAMGVAKRFTDFLTKRITSKEGESDNNVLKEYADLVKYLTFYEKVKFIAEIEKFPEGQNQYALGKITYTEVPMWMHKGALALIQNLGVGSIQMEKERPTYVGILPEGILGKDLADKIRGLEKSPEAASVVKDGGWIPIKM